MIKYWEFNVSELGEFLDSWDDGYEPLVPDEVKPVLAGFKDVTSVIVEGVYVLLLGMIIVYVGQAKCLAIRIGQHREQGKIKFDSVKIFPCLHKGRRSALERALIKEFNPKHNIRHNEYAKQTGYTRQKPEGLIPLNELMKKVKLVNPTVIVPMVRRI